MPATASKSLRTLPHRRKATKPASSPSAITRRTRARISDERSRVSVTETPDPVPAPSHLYPIAHAAAKLGLSIWTLRGMVYKGQCAFHRIGTKVLISDVEIERIIASSLRPATAA